MKGKIIGLSLIIFIGACFLPLQLAEAKPSLPTTCKVTGVLSSCTATFDENSQLYTIKGSCSCGSKGNANIDGVSANNACTFIDCGKICTEAYCRGAGNEAHASV